MFVTAVPIAERLLLSAEARLVLACVGHAGDPDTIAAVARPNLDWDQVVDVAEAARVTPLVYYGLNALTDSPVPEETFERLRARSVRYAMHFIELSAALEELLSACAAKGIPVGVLKGAAMALAVYSNQALRVVGDLDLLVREEDLGPAHEVMRELGYTQSDKTAIGPEHHHVPGYRRGDELSVELHRHIVPPPALHRIPVEDLWRLNYAQNHPPERRSRSADGPDG